MSAIRADESQEGLARTAAASRLENESVIQLTDPALPERVRRRVFLRTIPWLFVLYVIAYLDRVNVSYATLEMTTELGFSPRVYGFGAGVFFIGYFLLEVPGAVIAARWGVRPWICRIMVSWGIIAVAMGFIRTATEFYWLRFLLGLGEAGFFPALIVYLTKWFTARDRAKAIALFMSATSVAMAMGGPVSGLLMKLDWFGLSGWRWLFILEGAPAIVFGLASLLVITERPQNARWLSPEEKKWLERELEADRRAQLAREGPSGGLKQAISDPRVWVLSAAYFCAMVTIFGLGLWLPTIIKSASGRSTLIVSFLVALPYTLGFFSKLAVGWSSDHFHERRWHIAAVLCIGAAGLGASTLAPANLVVAFSCICAAVIGSAGFSPVFWAYASSMLGGTAAAAAVGVINSIGNLGGFAGPYIMGWTRQSSNAFTVGILVLAGSAATAALLVLSVELVRRQMKHLPPPSER